ncbi:Up in starvation [Neocucurbitaria cava]|uniref:Up in starvation n=1 Tax=Neocucurbitaria cava TaxID=798079 RepID=A0A9W9CPS5_9PLEO|nr:Up in starvation [Neocucurbitaria cava]
MSTFKAVNTTLTVPDPPLGRAGDETTPTTPRPNSRFFTESKASEDIRAEDPSAKTPTRNTFAGLAGQRPLPSSPFTPSRELSETPSNKSDLSRENSHRSTQSIASQQDVQMGEGEEDDKDGSDNESVNSDTNRPSKKKKGQRFFCTEFPPCNLSFTRSEHLARHIRKHTGERPFQCHCSRRFSRLDNLRQHAQTVHVNEDIPAESLAATGTRFQRQIRTDRVRPPGNRSRANTLGSTPGHSRGHSRNLSASSITSTISSMSVAQSPDARRRPAPLAIASDGGAGARARLSLNTMDAYNPPLMGSPGPQIIDYDTQSNAPTTPTSATFSTATGSPARFGSAMQSPVSTSRPVSWAGPPPPGRRLSISSTGNPFSGPPGQGPPPYMTPLQSSTAPTFSGQSHEKRTSISWDIDRLKIASPNPPREQWANYHGNSGQSSTGRPTTAPHGYFSPLQPPNVPQAIQVPPTGSPRTSQDQPVTPRKNKRQAWYNGPVAQPQRAMQRTSPEDSSSSEGVPTPGTMAEYHPAIVHSNGHVEAIPPGAPLEEYKPASPESIMDRPHPLYSPQYQSYHSHSLSNSSYRPQREPERGPVTFGQPLPQPGANDMRRLEALVAVATNEQQAVENRS